jgi:hypothetical protein
MMDEDPLSSTMAIASSGFGDGGGTSTSGRSSSMNHPSSNINANLNISSHQGRIIRIHHACIAPLPLGSTLRVTASHLWDPSDSPGCAYDPTNAKSISKNAGRDAYNIGTSGFAGGSLGVGANNVLRENEDARSSNSSAAAGVGVGVAGGVGEVGGGNRTVDDNATREYTKQQLQQQQRRDIMMGVRDSRSRWYASSVEMVTTPETYPLWRTRRPVIVALTDATATTTSNGTDSMQQEEEASSGVHHHRYRYLVVTPGAETESSHGLMGNVGDEDFYPETDDLADIQNMIHRTKISSGNLIQQSSVAAFEDNVMTSNDYGSSFPVTLWENPFLTSTNDGMGEDTMMEDAVSREVSTSAFSVVSEATSTRPHGGGGNSGGGGGGGGGGNSRDYDLVNLPFRTLDIDVATASVVKVPSSSNERMNEEEEDSPKYTEDGILIDTWNDCNDDTFQSFRILEGINAQRGSNEEDEVRDLDMASSLSEGGDSTTMVTETEKQNHRIFIVCYHLPVTVSKDPNTGEWCAYWAESLLAKTENSSFVSAYNPHWVGTVTTDLIIDENDKRALRSILAAMDCTVLFFDEAVRDAHYKGFCKQVLWLAFHHVDLLDMRDPAFAMDLEAASANHIQSDGTLLDLRSSWDQRTFGQWWEAFKIVNHAFAEEVAKMVSPEDVVWVHDYHLSLLPKLLGDEEKKANAPSLTKKIFFLHIPFPVSMIFKELECGPAILEGMLHADVVGFHGFTDARHFLSSSKRILGVSHENLIGGLIGVKYKKRIVAVTMSSVSIEPAMVDSEN